MGANKNPKKEDFFYGQNQGEVWTIFQDDLLNGTLPEKIVEKYMAMNKKFNNQDQKYYFQIGANGEIMLNSKGHKILNTTFMNQLKAAHIIP
jgi:hypothetical protein